MVGSRSLTSKCEDPLSFSVKGDRCYHLSRVRVDLKQPKGRPWHDLKLKLGIDSFRKKKIKQSLEILSLGNLTLFMCMYQAVNEKDKIIKNVFRLK